MQITWRSIAITVALAVIIAVLIGTVLDKEPQSHTESIGGVSGRLSTPDSIGIAKYDGQQPSELCWS